jgi:hypothetical protein
LKVFTDSNQDLYYAEGGAWRKRRWQDLETEDQGAIIASLISSSPVPPKREIVRGAAAFAYVHGLPELATELVRP